MMLSLIIVWFSREAEGINDDCLPSPSLYTPVLVHESDSVRDGAAERAAERRASGNERDAMCTFFWAVPEREEVHDTMEYLHQQER